uniref:Hematopoietic cell signal transducer n=1 Tax=Fundulus heteroclitus TaxID=8078 RepID=A0A3Q2QQA4_FUNHE
ETKSGILQPTSFLLSFSVCLRSPDSNVSCYRIEPGTIAAIIFADLLLTLIIVVVTYRCASFQRRKLDNADKVYMNVRANLKNPN